MSDRSIKPSSVIMHLPPKQSSHIAKLAQKRCTSNCTLDGISIKALSETGAQVSIISEQFLCRHFPSAKLRNISKPLDCELNLTAATGTPIPHKGFIELTFTLQHKQYLIFVPFFVTTDDILLPLVGL